MSQITIRDLPAALDNQLRKMAEADHSSLNKTIQSILMHALGLSGDLKRKRDRSDMAGLWGPEEVDAY